MCTCLQIRKLCTYLQWTNCAHACNEWKKCAHLQRTTNVNMSAVYKNVHMSAMKKVVQSKKLCTRLQSRKLCMYLQWTKNVHMSTVNKNVHMSAVNTFCTYLQWTKLCTCLQSIWEMFVSVQPSNICRLPTPLYFGRVDSQNVAHFFLPFWQRRFKILLWMCFNILGASFYVKTLLCYCL